MWKDAQIMPKPRSSRPANRPSRRHEILEAAIDLLAVQPPDEIAVSDIAAHCGLAREAVDVRAQLLEQLRPL